jgi:putative transposase
MPIRKVKFVEEEIYHVCSRGVERRDIFLEDKDYLRFIHNLYEFNDEGPVLNTYYRRPYEAGPHKIRKERKQVVDILTFTLMPNHYHLLLTQRRDLGITNFMHKLGTGYAMYFNEKYQRSGVLFQGTFKAIHVEREAHLTHLPFYIHANPLDLKFPEWRQGKMRDPEAAIKFLEEYRWSSFPDYIGRKNFPSVVNRTLLSQMFGAAESYLAHTAAILKEMDLEKVKDVALEEV